MRARTKGYRKKKGPRDMSRPERITKTAVLWALSTGVDAPAAVPS